MKKLRIIVILILLTFLGGIFRFANITNNPNSLDIDEVSDGYNAYSILKTGKDEYGNFLPLTFRSTGDYKPAGAVYPLVPSIAIFGLNEFGVRFPSAFISTITIPLVFLLTLQLLKGFEVESNESKHSQIIALLVTALLAISPWAIYFSRYWVEYSLAAVLGMMGSYFLLRMLSGKIWSSILAAVFFVLSMFAYHSERLFIPLLVISFIGIFYKQLLKQKRQVLIFMVISILLGLPLVYNTLFGHEASRAVMTFISQDIEFNRNVDVGKLSPNSLFGFIDNRNFLLFFYWSRKYLFYFHPSFLFYSGLNMTQAGTQGLGIVCLFELPFLIFGVYKILSQKFRFRWLVVAWILLGILPASLTQNEQHAGRSLEILPVLVFVSGLGAFHFFRSLLNLKGIKKTIWLTAFTFIVLINLLQAFLIFAVHFPIERGEDFMEGTKPTVLYALAHQNEYQQIVFDPYRGIETPNIVSIPHMYVLFYSRYDPRIYQSEQHIQGNDYFQFNKFVFRRVDWSKDRAAKGTLFIASPWAIPEKDLKPSEQLQKVNLSNGATAFIIASPK